MDTTNVFSEAVTSLAASSALVPTVQPADTTETAVTTLVVAAVSYALNLLFTWWRSRKKGK